MNRFMKARTAVITLAVAGVIATAIASTVSATPAPGCHLTQPVYTNGDYKLIGTWQATLPAGEEVNLPDDDVATCTAHGLDIEQP